MVFTSGGTESNNHAIRGIAWAYRTKGNHIVTSQIEHPAVLEVSRLLEANGFEVTYLPVDESGLVRVSDVEEAIRPETTLITIMHANNEVGTIQPIEEISRLARSHDIIMHTDAAQSVGKIPARVDDLDVDLLSIAGHKVYAPKGIGALFVRDSIRLDKLLYGAGQEGGRRAGTENVLEIVGLGKACEIAKRDLEQNAKQMRTMRDLLEKGITGSCQPVRLNGHPDRRLPNTLSVAFNGLEANRILEQISPEVAASAGAACHSGRVELSHVLEAMGVPTDWAKGTIRFSTGRMTAESDMERAIDVVAEAVQKMRDPSMR
jgi:cysteine desulfurase